MQAQVAVSELGNSITEGTALWGFKTPQPLHEAHPSHPTLAASG